MAGLTLDTGPASYPVTVAEAKAWCRVSGTALDTVFDDMIAAATARIEALLGRALVSQDWLLSLDAFDGDIVIEKEPVLEVTSVTYDDPAGAEQTLSATAYIVDLVSSPQRIVLAEGHSWPATAAWPNAVRIAFTSGYDTVPPEARVAILRTVAAMNDDPVDGGLPAGVAADLEQLRAKWFAA